MSLPLGLVFDEKRRSLLQKVIWRGKGMTAVFPEGAVVL
jgi:hypothetical protein